MTTSALQLVKSQLDPRGNRYTSADHEAAFLCWVTIARRSFTTTSEKTGISENTLRQWAKAGDWIGRGKAKDHETAELARVAVMSSVVAELDMSIAKLVALRDDANQPGKVQLDAALALLAIGGITTKQSATTVTAIAHTVQTQPVARLTDEERARLSDQLSRRMLEGFASA